MSADDPKVTNVNTVDLGYGAVPPDYNISYSSGVDTITLDPSYMTTSITSPTWTTTSGGAIGATGSTYTISTGAGYNGSWTTTGSSYGNVNITGSGIDMAAGTDLKIDGKSLKHFMDKMEERLAILVPDPAKLEKFEALRKAYDHYKLMEKLCQEEKKEDE